MAHTLIISASGIHSELSSEIPANFCDREIVLGLLQFSGMVPSDPRYVNVHTDLTYGFYVNGAQNNTISHITNITDGTVNINYEPAHIKWCTSVQRNNRRARFWFTDEEGDPLEVTDPDITIQLSYV